MYVVWIDNSPSVDSSQVTENKKILFRRSGDEGRTLGETITLNDNDGADSNNQEIAAPTDGININSADLGSNAESKSRSIMITTSADIGETFKKSVSLSNSAFKSYPKIAAHGNSVNIVWNVGIIGDANHISNKDNNLNPGIFFAISFDNGDNFSNSIKLNSDWNAIGESQVSAYESDIYVVWGGIPDDKLTGNLFYARSTDNSTTFSAAKHLTGKDTLNVEVAANNDDVYIAWQGIPQDNNEEIFVKKSSDAGETFTTNENVNKNEGISECTSMTISKDTDKVYLAWEDGISGNHEILFSPAAMAV